MKTFKEKIERYENLIDSLIRRTYEFRNMITMFICGIGIGVTVSYMVYTLFAFV